MRTISNHYPTRRARRGKLVVAEVLILVALNIVLIALLGETYPPAGAPLSAQDNATLFCKSLGSFAPPAVGVDFQMNATGGERPYTYFWSFGDGASNASSMPEMVHFYQQFGEFIVRGVVYDATEHHVLANAIYVNASLATC